jgi:hypothetical protein
MRRLQSILAVACLVLALLLVGLGIRSYWYEHAISYRGDNVVDIWAVRGHVWIGWGKRLRSPLSDRPGIPPDPKWQYGNDVLDPNTWRCGPVTFSWSTHLSGGGETIFPMWLLVLVVLIPSGLWLRRRTRNRHRGGFPVTLGE